MLNDIKMKTKGHYHPAMKPTLLSPMKHAMITTEPFLEENQAPAVAALLL